MSRLFEGDSDSDAELTTNSEYAKNYEIWRKKEELHKLQARYGEAVESETSSSSDEDDQPNNELDKDFFKALSCLKRKDKRIYDKSYEFFTTAPSKPTKQTKQKPIYVKDYERQQLLENQTDTKPPLTYAREQHELKQGLKEALKDDEESDEDLFHIRAKTHKQQAEENQEYAEWLAGQTKNLQDNQDEEDLRPLRRFWNDPELDGDEKFLRDYLLKKRFLEVENEDYVPSYEEIVHDSDRDLSEDERAIDKQEEFEHKYNFRFEEPDQEFIKRYPRTMENSLRQKDEKRKTKRLERRDRKAVEKQEKLAEIAQMKKLKKAEIQEKIDRLKEITGNAEIAFDVADVEGDFDPEEHDKRMRNLFNEEFYQGEEEDQKPQFPDLDEELELEKWDHWHGNEGEETNQPHCEDDDFNMDCDYDPSMTHLELTDSKRKKKRKRKSKFAQVLSEPRPVFDPVNDRTYEEYLDEYYKLDCEDVIGDLPCRFKYRKVVPNDFGLTVEEILTAKDKELNRWCSLKKALQIQPEHVEKYDVIAFAKKGKNIDLKRKYLPSLFEENSNESSTSPETVTKKQTTINKPRDEKQTVTITPTEIDKKETVTKTQTDQKQAGAKQNKTQAPAKTKIKNDLTSTTEMFVVEEQTEKKNKKRKRKDGNEHSNQKEETETKMKKRKRKQSNKKGKVETVEVGMTDSRLAAYGFKPKKYKNKLKYSNTK